MKNLLLAVGILLLVACLLFLVFAAFCQYGRYHVLDGSPVLYKRLERRALISCAVGVVLALGGIACIVIRSRI